MRRLSILVLLCLPGCFPACPTSEDAEARERLLGPEEPPIEEIRAQEPLDAERFGTDPTVRRRVLWMEAAEMRHRLGSFQARNEVRFSWRRGSETVELEEQAHLDQATSGDFRVAVENDQDFGFELRWAGGKVYVRSQHGKFFERRPDRAGHFGWREEAMAQLGTFLTLVDGRVAIARTGTGTHQGRGVVKYTVATSVESDEAATPPPRPHWARDPVYPEGGPDESLQHRLAVLERGSPVSLSGEISVDDETAVVLAYTLRAVYQVPPPEGTSAAEAAVLDVRMERQLREVGGRVAVDVPEHEPFSPRPRAVTDPLAWWPKHQPEAEKKKAADGEAKAPADTK